MTAPELVAALRGLEERFRREADRLNGLDQALGDGDHGATLVRGFAAITGSLPSSEDTAGAILTQASKDFLGAAGGASGALFSTLFREIGAQCGQELDAESFCRGLSAATDRIMRKGKAGPGDKTMVDALEPACAAVKDLDAAASLGNVIATAATAAEIGADSTIDMTARRGRARYVEDGGRGHVDPGATSVALLLRTLAEQAERAT